MTDRLLKSVYAHLHSTGEAIFFLGNICSLIARGRVRWGAVLDQMYEQGVQTTVIVILTSLATGAVLGLQGSITLQRFGAKEFIARLVALSLIRELSPVFTSLIFSGKAGAGMTAELGTMATHDQILATRAMGVDPLEYLVVPRFLACFLVLPVLVIISEFFGIAGGYLIAVTQAHTPGPFYIHETLEAVGYVDFFSGFIKVFFFAVIIAWICSYQGFFTRGGAVGVGRFTTKAVAYSYIAVIISNTVLTKIILTFWG
ncbi:MAG: ABC transporter permease [Candidatus Omnitrophica bacterium]|nr:ABC transporter permease [Candidatus Omnitrophota bacterium]MDE2009195.1 ABC transporter permease [Candidatus Omnitrophota bacterium]MDE2213716.1 ABC transporter permease [Candidatus Omnitrophota bacterium]MDE2230709.1 ABC transporter permease [Candidatus Omnitrophota bacterium]